MQEALATILVAMAGAFLLYALRLAWLRRYKTSNESAVVAESQPAPAARDEAEAAGAPLSTSAATPVAAPKRIALEDYESVPAPFTGAFHSPLNKLIGDTWLALGYVVVTVAITTLLTNFVKTTALFVALQIPLIILCTYVVSPDPNVARRLPFNWSVTAVLALLVYLLQTATKQSAIYAFNGAAGLVAWVLVVYWIVSAVRWSVKIAHEQKAKLARGQALELFALLCATWGAVFEIASLLVWIILSLWSDLARTVPSVHALFSAITLMKTLPVLRFLPLEIVAASLLVLTALRMKDDHYVPRSLDEFLPVREDSFFAPFVLAFRIPVWIMVVIIEFVIHFSRLAREALVDFARHFVGRLDFILLSFALAPLLFYIGHTLMLNALHLASAYYHASGLGFLEGLKYFFVINLMLLAALCFYVLAVPPLAARLRRVPPENFSRAVHRELVVQGKAYVLALGHTFSLLGVLPFVIPVVSILPGGPSFGMFSLLYSIIVLAGFGWYVTSRDNEEEYVAELEEAEPATPTEEDNSATPKAPAQAPTSAAPAENEKNSVLHSE